MVSLVGIQIGNIHFFTPMEFLRAILFGHEALPLMNDVTIRHRLVAVASIITNKVWQLRNEVVHENKYICFKSLSRQIKEDLDIKVDCLDLIKKH